MKKVLITIPCYNEELVLEKTTFAVAEYAKEHLSQYDWQVMILDNNSNDNTWHIANTLKEKYGDRLLTTQVGDAGRGVAIRKAWLKFGEYDIYSYVDADLSTDMKDFAFIISKVDEGYDLVTGSRYLPNSDLKRDFIRKFLSVVYNKLLKVFLGVNFMDAQCGFKAMASRLVKDLFPKTVDSGWFWDTELMIIASLKGYKVLEVPVSWREARDELRKSTVMVFREVFRNLKNIFKMRKRIKSGF